MPRELELKYSSLEGRVPGVAELAGALAPLGLQVEGRGTRRQEDVYYDDAEGTLAAAGLALRVRAIGCAGAVGGAGAVGRARVVAVKGRGDAVAGLFEREELEAPLAGPAAGRGGAADAAVDWPAPIAARLAGVVDLPALAPVLEIVTLREVFTLGRAGEPVAEVAFDEVTCRPPRAGAAGALIEEAAFSEVEVEALGEGTALELRRVGAALEALLPLVAGDVSKLERASALLAPFL